MTREIKFRAWDKNLKDMYEVLSFDLFNGGKSGEIILNTTNDEATDKLEDCVLMQFTGFIDKNGIDIYEGDIVRYHYMEEGRSVVQYSETWVSYEPFSRLQERVWETIEVIGNIYKNPELLNANN